MPGSSGSGRGSGSGPTSSSPCCSAARRWRRSSSASRAREVRPKTRARRLAGGRALAGQVFDEMLQALAVGLGEVGELDADARVAVVGGVADNTIGCDRRGRCDGDVHRGAHRQLLAFHVKSAHAQVARLFHLDGFLFHAEFNRLVQHHAGILAKGGTFHGAPLVQYIEPWCEPSYRGGTGCQAGVHPVEQNVLRSPSCPPATRAPPPPLTAPSACSKLWPTPPRA